MEALFKYHLLQLMKEEPFSWAYDRFLALLFSHCPAVAIESIKSSLTSIEFIHRKSTDRYYYSHCSYLLALIHGNASRIRYSTLKLGTQEIDYTKPYYNHTTQTKHLRHRQGQPKLSSQANIDEKKRTTSNYNNLREQTLCQLIRVLEPEKVFFLCRKPRIQFLHFEGQFTSKLDSPC